MPSKARRALFVTAAALLGGAVAQAQQPYTPFPPSSTQSAAPALPSGPQPYVPRSTGLSGVSDVDSQLLSQALVAARRGDVAGARSAISGMGDPLARKIGTWALVDTASGSMSFFELDQARRDLAGWPRGAKRQSAAEKQLSTAPYGAQQVVDWFAGAEPTTAEGAMALASAYRQLGREPEAAALIKRFWRERVFEVEPQRAMLARFGSVLTMDDHVRRADILLYGTQGPAAREMIVLLPADQQALALTRIALRNNDAGVDAMIAALSPSVKGSAGLAFERAAYARRKGLDSQAIALLGTPNEASAPSPDAADRVWDVRYPLVLAALKSGDSRGAYTAAANSGLTQGGDAADAEFYAGWIALRKLNDPVRADIHFANLEKIGSSPITRGRALYWRGRAADARKDPVAAKAFYEAAAKYNLTFYGQLAAEKVGDGRLVLNADPAVTDADRARFEGRESVRAARMLYDMGQRDLFRAFVLALDDILPTTEEQALLVDLARGYSDQDTSMKVVRTAAQRGFALPHRGYPVRTPPSVMGAPEPALVLGITRQESGFDPMVRSGVGARGMMQLMPATASLVARQTGVSYSPGMLDDPEYNMRLGSSYLGQMVTTFSGSYVMAVAAYNAGPGRPAQWVNFCGDPRGATDPIDFIECIPFGETRNYVMRVLEGMQVYRAKLNGGSAPITLSEDLKRGGYRYSAQAQNTIGEPVSR